MAGFSVGDRVTQPQYGNGTITASNDYHTVIDFDEHGSRTFSTRLVQLERSVTSAPAKAAKSPRRRSSTPKASKT